MPLAVFGHEMEVPLQQPCASLGQRTPLALQQRNVRGKRLAAHALPGVHKAVAAAVHIGIVDLRRISDQHQLAAT